MRAQRCQPPRGTLCFSAASDFASPGRLGILMHVTAERPKGHIAIFSSQAVTGTSTSATSFGTLRAQASVGSSNKRALLSIHRGPALPSIRRILCRSVVPSRTRFSRIPLKQKTPSQTRALVCDGWVLGSEGESVVAKSLKYQLSGGVGYTVLGVSA